jgi:hypothetical protein
LLGNVSGLVPQEKTLPKKIAESERLSARFFERN